MARPALHLLGSPTLFDASGSPISGGPAQRHRIALLAQLAIACPRGVSRERLIGTLWPNRDTRAGRRLLNVAIRVLRRTFGDDALLTVGHDLRLNPEAIDRDVARFETAADGGRLEEAVECCGGVFLEGFFLDDAEEFERWVEVQRLRLARKYTNALTVLAERATRDADWIKAANWWRALNHAEPSSTDIVLHLFDALEATGDITGAFAVDERHTAYMRGEMGIEPDARVATRASVLRASLTQARRDSSVPRIAPVSGPHSAIVPEAVVEPTITKHGPHPARSTRRAWRAAAIAGFTFAVVGAVAFDEIVGRPVVISPPAAAVLAPVAGPDVGPGVADQVANLLILNLQQIEGLSFRRPDRSQSNGLVDGSLTALDAGRALNASLIVSGRISAASNSLTATFTVVDSSGALLGTATASVPSGPQNVPSLVDAVTIELVRVLWGKRPRNPEPRVADITTTSLPALRFFLRGEAAFRRLQYDSAASALQAAVDLDTTFALAYFRLGEVNGYRSSRVFGAMARAERLSATLPAREAAELGVWRLDQQRKSESYEAAVELLRRYPEDPDAKFAQADMAYQSRALRSMPLDSQYVLWDRAIAADPTSLRPLVHVIDLATTDDTPNNFDRYVAAALTRPGAPPRQFFATIRIARWGPLSVARDTLMSLAKAPPPPTNFGSLLMAVRNALTRHCFSGLVDGRETAEWAVDFMQRTFDAEEPMWEMDDATRNALALGSGRLTVRNEPDTREAAMNFADNAVGLAGLGAPAIQVIRAADANLARMPERSWIYSLHRAELAIALGDTAAAHAHIAATIKLERAEDAEGGGSFARPEEHSVDRALNGWLSATIGDTARGIAEMSDGLREAGYGAISSSTHVLRRELNRLMVSWLPTRDSGIARLRTSLSASGAYLPLVRLQLAKALDARGETTEAAEQYDRFALLWRQADPLLQHFGKEATDRAKVLRAMATNRKDRRM